MTFILTWGLLALCVHSSFLVRLYFKQKAH